MVNATQIQEHMEVFGSDGQHVGVVDHLDEGNRIKLTRKDPDARGQHHFVPLEWVASVDSAVRLNKTRDEAEQQWQAETAAEQNAVSSTGG